MFGKNRDPNKKKSPEPSKKFPSVPSSSMPNKKTTGNLNKPNSPDKKPGMDNFQRTNKADRGTGPLRADSNMDLSKPVSSGQNYTETTLDDGVTIIKYNEKQKIDNLIKDAKARVGGQTSKFFSKGWVVGKELAKISPDGLSITYYPEEVANLVQELIGYTNIDEK